MNEEGAEMLGFILGIAIGVVATVGTGVAVFRKMFKNGVF